MSLFFTHVEDGLTKKVCVSSIRSIHVNNHIVFVQIGPHLEDTIHLVLPSPEAARRWEAELFERAGFKIFDTSHYTE